MKLLTIVPSLTDSFELRTGLSLLNAINSQSKEKLLIAALEPAQSKGISLAKYQELKQFDSIDPIEIMLEMERADCVVTILNEEESLKNFLKLNLPPSRLLGILPLTEQDSNFSTPVVGCFDQLVFVAKNSKATPELEALASLGDPRQMMTLTCKEGKNDEKLLGKEVAKMLDRLMLEPKRIRFFGINMLIPISEQKVEIADILPGAND